MADERPAAGEAESATATRDRLEFVATVILAIGVVLTAWTAFQATKWSGVQANSYAGAGAARTESAKASTAAGQETVVDVVTFVSWLEARNEEILADPAQATMPYTPRPDTLSGFLYERLRDEFRPALAAWLELRPLQNLDAPPTPFVMPEYVVADQARADELVARADDLAARARRANQRADNYVMVTVLFAAGLFFAGVSSKFESDRSRRISVGMAVLIVVVGVVVLATFPVEV